MRDVRLMVTTGIQNLPQPLARAQAAYRDSTARLAAVSRDRLARCAGSRVDPDGWFPVTQDVARARDQAA